MTDAGRNDPCPCGSGKKYKQCCLTKASARRTAGTEETLMRELVRDLFRFAKKHHEKKMQDAYGFFAGAADDEASLTPEQKSTTEINYSDWLVYDWIVDTDKGKTLIDLYLEHDPGLRPGQRDILGGMRESIVSLYEVAGVVPEESMKLRDLLLRGTVEVREKSATRILLKGDVLALRLLPLDNGHIMSGCAYGFKRKHRARVLDAVNERYKAHREQVPAMRKRVFLKRSSPIFNMLWRTLNRAQRPTGPAEHLPQDEYTEFMKRNYEKWLNEKIPSLEGKTPREAVHTKTGKQKVVELVKNVETIEKYNKLDGRPHFDVSWVWERLGIKRPD
ncbi:MAG: SEC-C metal-binding domain-containing protein [Pseudomonadota bacterium]